MLLWHRALHCSIGPSPDECDPANIQPRTLSTMLTFLKRYWFLAGLIGAIGLGFLLPQVAAGEGLLAPGGMAKIAVAGIFFLRGLLLPLTEVWRGVSAWRLHLLTHTYLFIFTPLVILGLLAAWELFAPLRPEWRLGFFFLAILPTTISSAVVYTSRAGGNAAGAIFNATASNLLAVLIVPLWIGWYLAVEAESFPVRPVVVELARFLVAPLLLGQAFRAWFAGRADGNKQTLEIAGNVLLLFIVFLVFAKSVLDGVWQEHAGWSLAAVFALCSLFYLFLQVGASTAGRVARLERGDFICHFFCAPQKTLAAGAPMASILFADHPGLPMILLPILFYHFAQLTIGGGLVENFRKQRTP